jgi:hypothetical protein
MGEIYTAELAWLLALDRNNPLALITLAASLAGEGGAEDPVELSLRRRAVKAEPLDWETVGGYPNRTTETNLAFLELDVIGARLSWSQSIPILSSPHVEPTLRQSLGQLGLNNLDELGAFALNELLRALLPERSAAAVSPPGLGTEAFFNPLPVKGVPPAKISLAPAVRDRQTDWQTDRQTDRQTHPPTPTCVY